MTTDAAVVVGTEFADITTVKEVITLAQFAPMQPGRSFLVFANGMIEAGHVFVTIELEAFDAKHAIQTHGPGQTAFTLAVGTTLPADDDLFTVAKVSARMDVDLTKFDPPNPDPAHQHGTATVSATRLVVLAVDTLTVQGAQVSPKVG